MRYEILGSPRVVTGDNRLPVPTRKGRTLFGALLVRAGQVVTTDQLMAEMWGDDMPRQAALGLQVYVSRLRKLLARPGPARGPLVTKPAGYVLHLDGDEFDVHTFLELLGHGREHVRNGDLHRAVSAFDQALAQWRGPVLSDHWRGPILGGFVSWMAAARTECAELLLEAQLRLGMHHELIGRLYALTTAHPHSETFYRLLMLALFRADRRADALGVYDLARRTLHDGLGLEPSRALREAQRAILLGVDPVCELTPAR